LLLKSTPLRHSQIPQE